MASKAGKIDLRTDPLRRGDFAQSCRCGRELEMLRQYIKAARCRGLAASRVHQYRNQSNTHLSTSAAQVDSSTEAQHLYTTTDHLPAKVAVDGLSDNGNAFAHIRKDLMKTFSRIIEQKMKNEEMPSYENIAAESESMLKRQLKIEEEQLLEAASMYHDTFNNLSKMGKGTSMKSAQRLLLQWYEPMMALLFKEIEEIESGKFSADRNQYGPYLLLLPVEKIAVITLNTTLNCILRSGNIGEKLVKIAIEIANMMEAEVNMQVLKMGRDVPKWKKKITVEASQNVSRKSLGLFNKNLRKAANEREWTSATKVKVGAKAIDLLLRSAVHGEVVKQPSFVYTKNFYHHGRSHAKQMGYVRLDADMFKEFMSMPSKHSPLMLPRFLPMLVPPKPWNNRQYSGAYFRMKAPLMKAISPSQTFAVRRADITTVLESLDYLGQVGWRINPLVHDVVQEAWDQKLVIAELPGIELLPQVEQESCHRPIGVIRAERQSQYMRANQKRKANQPEVGVETVVLTGTRAVAGAEGTEGAVAVGPRLWLLEEGDELLPEDTMVYDDRYYKNMRARVGKKNAEMHSLRCDLKIKLDIADKFRDQTLFFPHNIDFRGRAYPIPPNLSHLGSDLCRGLMMFDQAKPLGSEGLDWLKVHLANLFGHNKITRQERIDWTDAHLEELADSAESPLKGDRWWAEAENPFQALAACGEIHNAINSGNPSTYLTRLPVHQDGSCNGLQHYAGLGRDELGAAAVNLVPHDKPQDVYSNVLDKVIEKVARDALIPLDDPNADVGVNARLVQDVVNRKVIKQTVMTSVYGVTRVGARAQIEARLKEKLHSDQNAIISPESEKEIYAAAQYLAGLTLDSLAEMFKSARDIMDWLGQCAKLVSVQERAMSWVTPLGLPVIQPYRKVHLHTVSTVLQTITLTLHADHLPVSGKKQRTAFPPNFVHSMDASHMMMTCMRMKQRNLTFAAVHDSYWTHPSDIPIMNECLREAFVELYEYPVLEELRESLQLRFPEVDFPEIPQRGTLDIKSVKNSTYFFH